MSKRFSPSFAILLFLSACDGQDGQGSKSSDLPEHPDRWIETVALQPDSKARHVGKSSMVLGSTTVSPLSELHSVSLGDEIEGVFVRAIKCSFHKNDEYYSGSQFMWRGRWACMAGRDHREVDNAVQENGDKLYDYIHISPVTLD